MPNSAELLKSAEPVYYELQVQADGSPLKAYAILQILNQLVQVDLATHDTDKTE